MKKEKFKSKILPKKMYLREENIRKFSSQIPITGEGHKDYIYTSNCSVTDNFHEINTISWK